MVLELDKFLRRLSSVLSWLIKKKLMEPKKTTHPCGRKCSCAKQTMQCNVGIVSVDEARENRRFVDRMWAMYIQF